MIWVVFALVLALVAAVAYQMVGDESSPTGGARPAPTGPEDGSEDPSPPSDGPPSGAVASKSPATANALDEAGSAKLPLEEVRYAGFLERAGITTESDLKALSALTEVNQIGADRGQAVAEDLIAEGVDRSVIPPVTSA